MNFHMRLENYSREGILKTDESPSGVLELPGQVPWLLWMLVIPLLCD